MRNITDLDKVFKQFSTEYQEREFQLLNQSFFLHLSDVQSGGTLRSMVGALAEHSEGVGAYLGRKRDQTQSLTQQALDTLYQEALDELKVLWGQKRDKVLFATGDDILEKALKRLMGSIYHHLHLPPQQFISVYSEQHQLKTRLLGQLDLSHYSSVEANVVLDKIIQVFHETQYPTHTLNFSVFVVAATKPSLRTLFVVLEDLLMDAARALKMVPGMVTVHVQKITSSKLDVIEANESHFAVAAHVHN